MNTTMTKTIRMLAVALLCVLPSSLYAADGDVFTAKTVEGIDMEFKVISESSKTCEVGSNRDRSGVWAAINDSTTGTITIPSIANDYMVIGIGREAFRYCSFLSSIIIPNSVTYIEYDAFQFCYSLASITIPNSVTSIKSLAFRDCKSLKSIIIPNSVTSIDKDTFEGCSLSSVEFHCRDITAFMFRDHESLEEVIIGDEVKYIGMAAFNSCSNLKNVILGCSLEEIQLLAFCGCRSLTDITFPNSVTYIGGAAFEGCSSLTSIRIPSSVRVVDYAAFVGCDSLRKVIIPDIESWLNITFFPDGGNPLENGGDLYLSDGEQKITEIVIPNSTKSIKDYVFAGYVGLTNVTIPNSVTSIGEGAFFGCSGLTSIDIPNSVTNIGGGAFDGCSGLTSIDIPNSVTTIKSSAFYGCSGLTSITIPNSVTTIESYAFSGCSVLTNVTIPNSVTNIGEGAFLGCSGLTSITIPNSLAYIGSKAFNNYSLKWVLSLIEVPFAINTVFNNNTSLYVLPGNKEKYEEIEGWNQMVIKEVPLPNFTYTTDEGIEMVCSMISYDDLTCQVGDGTHSAISDNNARVLKIPDKMFDCDVVAIGDNAFQGCNSLISVSFPKGIASIDQNSLRECWNLVSVQWNADTPLSLGLLSHISNPNFLLYVKDKSYAPANIQNVVVNGNAESVVLQDAADGNNFYCPETFTAAQTIYTHRYTMKSGYETCQGWETIVLPFDVSYIYDQSKMELTPFVSWSHGNSLRPFWLYRMTENGGWQEAPSIKANVPYIISMPNNSVYPSAYNIAGDITFMATNAQIIATTDLQTVEYGNKKFMPNYQNEEASDDIYALNVNNQWNHYDDDTPVAGSAFIKRLRQVRPFEAYLTVSGVEAAKRAIPVFSGNMPTGMSHFSNHRMDYQTTKIYNLQGQRVACPRKGLYINKGKKVIAK